MAAETSLATFASGRILGLTRFTKASNIVLRSSNIKTKKIVNAKSANSAKVNLRSSAVTRTIVVTVKCTRKLGSLLVAVANPEKAYLKLFIIECFRFIIVSLYIKAEIDGFVKFRLYYLFFMLLTHVFCLDY